MEGRNKDQILDPRFKLIGARIKALRIMRGYKSQEKAALAFNINRTQWADYESGVEMKLSTFFRVLDGLQVTPQEFFAEGFE